MVKAAVRAWLAEYFGLLALLLPVLAVYSTGLNAGGFWWTDESRHVMNGVFMLDLFRDQPWSGPLEYALRYFAQYPALALNWYPPGFYIAEAPFLWVFGISEYSGRLTSLVFLGAGLIFYYRWASDIWGRMAAVLAGLILCLNPQSILWGRAMMLDLPATAMVMTATFFFDRYLRYLDWRSAIYFGVAVAAMLLVKQTTIFILPVFLIYPLITQRGHLLLKTESIVPFALALLALAFLVVHAIKFGGTGIAATVGDLHAGEGGKAPFLSLTRWALYGQTLLNNNTWPFVVTATIGAWVAAVGSRRKPQDAILILWVISWYVMGAVLFPVPGNSPRYTIYALPALALLACRSAYLFSWRGYHYGVLLLLSGYVATLWYSAFNTEPNHVNGYKEAAEIVLASPIRGTVMFAGKHDGNFVLHMRAGDAERRRVILRGDKTLVMMSVHKYFGIKSNVQSEEEIINMLGRDSVAWVVVDRPNITDIDEFELLWKVLQGPGFRLERAIPLQTNVSEYRNMTVNVYRRLAMHDVQSGPMNITIPVLGRDIKFDL